MARPAPDPEQVVAVYELAVEGWSYRDIIEQLGKRGVVVSLGTVSAWVKLGAAWWRETAKLTFEEEYAAQRGIIGYLIGEARAAYQRGEISFAEMEASMHRSLARHARLTGIDAPTRLSVDADRFETRPELSEDKVRAIEDMRERSMKRERGVIEGARDRSA